MMKVITFEADELDVLEESLNAWLADDQFSVVDIKLTAYGADVLTSRYVAMIVYTED